MSQIFRKKLFPKNLAFLYFWVLLVASCLDLFMTFLCLNAGAVEVNFLVPDYKQHLSLSSFLLYFGRLSLCYVPLFSFLFYLGLLRVEQYRPTSGDKRFSTFQEYNLGGGLFYQLTHFRFPYRGWLLVAGLMVPLAVPVAVYFTVLNSFFLYITNEHLGSLIYMLLRKINIAQQVAIPTSNLFFYTITTLIGYMIASFLSWKLVWRLEDTQNPPEFLAWLSRRTPLLLGAIVFFLIGFMWLTNMLLKTS